MGRSEQTEESGLDVVLAGDQHPQSELEEALARLREINTQWMADRNYQYEMNALYKVDAYDWMLDALQRSLRTIDNSRSLHTDARYSEDAYAYLRNLLAFIQGYVKEVSASNKWPEEYVSTIQELALTLALGRDEFKRS